MTTCTVVLSKRENVMYNPFLYIGHLGKRLTLLELDFNFYTKFSIEKLYQVQKG